MADPMTSSPASARILVVDDDPKIVNLVRAYLVSEGFTVITAADGLAALEAVRRERPDLIVLDLMLPEVDGLEVTRRLREQGSSVPILILSARGATSERVKGLVEGADDYLPKPFAPSEMIARVRAILRRAHGDPARVLIHDDLELDLERQEVRVGGRLIELSRLEFSLLAGLIEARGRILTRDRLMDLLSGPQAEGVLERSIDVYVARLRSKLGDDGQRPRYILTVRGSGYRIGGAR